MIFNNKRKAADTSEQAVYTCPMHPEVQSAEPGSCPKCGMFLVAKDEADKHDHASEHKHEAGEEASGGCCGGHGHKHAGKTTGGGCCGGQGHAHP